MATFAEDIEGALQEIRETYAKAATFCRGARETPLTDVVIGKRTFRFVDDNGFTVHRVTRDFIIEAAQLKGIEPRIGDRIKQTVNGSEQVYDVVSLNGEPCFYHSDDGENTIRIHTLFQSMK